MNIGVEISSPLVSVIIPTYNRADYLKIAIDSVLAQTYKNFELLILDNHSTDHTQKIVSSYSDSRIKSLRHLTNIGGVANWLYGIHWANGEFFSVLGDDDFYRDNFLESRVKTFISFPGTVAVFSDHETCDEFGFISNELNFEINNISRIFSEKALFEIIYAGRWQIGSTLFRQRPVVELWDQCIRAGKAFDSAVQVQIALLHTAVWIPDGGLVYRLHSGQDSGSGDKGIVIGIFNAFMEPLIFERHLGNNALLRRGAWWSLNYLAMDSLLTQVNVGISRKLFLLALLLRPNYLRAWFRLSVSVMPAWIRKRILNWRQLK